MRNLPKTTFNIKMNAHADTCGNKEYNAKTHFEEAIMYIIISKI